MSVFSNILKNTYEAGLRTAHRGVSRGYGLAGVAAIAAEHPIATTAVTAGVVAFGGYSSSARQAIPAGPAVQGGNPATDYTMGATGDLVFALHRNR